MNPKNGHKRILLSKNESGKIEFCEGCDVIELEVGPVSLRLHAQDLEVFGTLVQEADLQLKHYRAKKESFDTEVNTLVALH